MLGMIIFLGNIGGPVGSRSGPFTSQKFECFDRKFLFAIQFTRCLLVKSYQIAIISYLVKHFQNPCA